MNVTLRCDNCDAELRVAYDSWDNNPYPPRVIRFYPCSCVTDRLERILKGMDVCHQIIDQPDGNKITINQFIQNMQDRIAKQDAEIDRLNDKLEGIH